MTNSGPLGSFELAVPGLDLVRAAGGWDFLVQDGVPVVADGLLHLDGGLIVPSRAAARFDEVGP